jgi:hypothetical protein
VQNQATEYNLTISAVEGVSTSYDLYEDNIYKLNYELEIQKDSIDPWLKITKKPEFGKLQNCQEKEKFKLSCDYIPNENFYGVDSIELRSGDGLINANNKITLVLNVNPVDDAPVAQNDHLHFISQYNQQKEFKFTLPAQDIDTPQSDLSYVLDIPMEVDPSKIDCVGRNCVYLADANEVGTVYLSYAVKDLENESEYKTIQIDIGKQVFNTTDEFVVDQKNKGVEILWVIDNSVSMSPEQQDLATYFNSFASNLFDQDNRPIFDFQMAVTTTDTYLSRNQPSMYHFDEITLSSPASNDQNFDYTKAKTDFISEFGTAVNVGVGGDIREKAFDSARVVLDNENWKKDDHNLVVIFVSDEKEQSTYLTAPQWVDLFKNHNTNPVDKAYSIINLTYDDGKRYEDLSSLFGTSLYSVSDSFDSILSDISYDINKLVSSYSMNSQHNVFVDTLEVSVNGQLQTLEQDYTFIDNRISFNYELNKKDLVKINYSYSWK